MAKVLGLKQLLQKKYKLIDGLTTQFAECFGALEEVFIMMIWGQSASGKSSFTWQFVKELCRHGIVLYVCLEEGHSFTTQLKAKQFLTEEEIGKVRFADHEMNYDKLLQHLSKKKQAKFIVVDSVQYLNIHYEDYKALKEKFPRKSFIFISHAKGKNPEGSTAGKIRYDAGLKIRVEGKLAFIESRYGGTKNYVIWEQGAKAYWKKQYQKIISEMILKANFDKLTNWCHGVVGNYTFKALVFKEPSRFGINKGKVSKLMIKDQCNTIIVNYERSWDIRPKKSHHRLVYNRILNFLETAPFEKVGKRKN
jgi:hypothetical protein